MSVKPAIFRGIQIMKTMQTDIWTNFVEAQTTLQNLINFLEVAVHDSNSNKQNNMAIHKSCWSSLDNVLGSPGLHAGSSVEIYGSNQNMVYDFVLEWSAKIQQTGHVVAIVDPFKEIQLETLHNYGFKLDQCVMIDLQDPFELGSSIMQLIKSGALDLIIFPPGVMQQFWLDDRPTNNSNSAASLKEAFLRSLKSIMWLSKRLGTTIFLLDDFSRKRYSASPYVGQVRIKLLPQDTHNFRFAQIEQNTFMPESIGKRVMLYKLAKSL